MHQRSLGVREVQESDERGSRGERGSSLVEYAMLLALIAVVVFGAVSFFGAEAGGGFNHSRDCLEAAHAGATIPADCQ